MLRAVLRTDVGVLAHPHLSTSRDEIRTQRVRFFVDLDLKVLI